MQYRKLRKLKSSLNTEMFSPNAETQTQMEKETEMQRETQRKKSTNSAWWKKIELLSSLEEAKF